MRKTPLAVFVLGMMLALCRQAEGKPKNFPDCTKYTVGDGSIVCGFKDVNDWVKVLNADIELTGTVELLSLERMKSKKLSEKIGSMKVQFDALKAVAKLCGDRNKALTVDLLDTDMRLQNERAKPKFGNPIAWTAAALATAVLGVFLAHEYL